MARPQEFIQRRHSREEYQKIFSEADAKGNGYLTFEQFMKILKQKGYSGKKSDLKKYFKDIDKSGDKKLSETEFLDAMCLIPEVDHKSAFLRACFHKFDENEDGKIDRDELDQVFLQMKKDLPEAEINRMIKAVNRDGTGKLDYEEFIAVLYPPQ